MEGEKLALPCNYCLPGKGERVLPPTISIVIPLYNKRDYIERCLRSVRAQSFTDYQLVIVNDGSTDGCEKLVEPFLQSGDMVINQANGGHAAARNRGLAAAEGPLLASLDADDEWLPDHLACLHELYVRFPEAGLLSTGVRMKVGGRSEVLPAYKCIPKYPWEGLLPSYFLSSALGKYPVNSSVIAIPKKIYTDVGGCPVGVRWGEDADLWGKIALRYPIAFSWELGAIYHLNAANRACKQALPLKKEPIILTLQQAIMKGEISPERMHEIEEYISKRELARAIRCILSGDRTEAINIISKCRTRYLYSRKIMALVLLIMPTGLSQFMWDKTCRLLNIEG